jgi:hypothetical protein
MSDGWVRDTAYRIGDMHGDRSLHVTQMADGDIEVSVGRGRFTGPGFSDEITAILEFCAPSGGGGRSKHTRVALLALMEAIKKDNEEYPISE